MVSLVGGQEYNDGYGEFLLFTRERFTKVNNGSKASHHHGKK